MKNSTELSGLVLNFNVEPSEKGLILHRKSFTLLEASTDLKTNVFKCLFYFSVESSQASFRPYHITQKKNWKKERACSNT